MRPRLTCCGRALPRSYFGKDPGRLSPGEGDTGKTPRIANVKLDPTFLMADVEVAATYELFNINRLSSKISSTVYSIRRS